MSELNHVERRLAILQSHPGVRHLFGASPWTALFALAMAALQFLLAYAIRDQPWWAALLLAFAVGAFIIHGLNCVIHECTHNLVFRGAPRNKALAILATLPSLVPAASSFRHYHLLHHRAFGVRRMDADVPLVWETKLVGRNWFAKLIWVLLLPFGYTVLRPICVRQRMPLDRWFWANLVAIALVWVATVHLLGWTAVLYLLTSSYLSVGPHPAGAHILQEHIAFDGGDGRASYYGSINWISVNLGYHLEHHDLPHVAGWRLPKIRKLAPGFYADHFVHSSRALGMWQFIFDPAIGLDNRAGRDA
jgi:sphingolipid delta-4 desaturase